MQQTNGLFTGSTTLINGLDKPPLKLLLSYQRLNYAESVTQQWNTEFTRLLQKKLI